MSTVDWSRAPEDATHYAPETKSISAVWCKLSHDGWKFINVESGGVWQSDPTPDDPTRYILRPESSATSTPRIAAHEFLERGVKHMRDRAVQRDSDAGERSMARAVAAFNAQEGTNLTEAQGWRFMIQLKYSRSVHGVFVADDFEDMAAYAGLAGEAAQ